MYKACRRCHETSGAHLPARILEVYVEDLIGVSHVHHPDGLHNTLLSQGCALETAPAGGTVGRVYIPRAEDG